MDGNNIISGIKVTYFSAITIGLDEMNSSVHKLIAFLF